MTHSHTPGPWVMKTVPTSVGHCHKIGPFPSTSKYREQVHACVYVDGLGLKPEDAPELLANARLIAAAPELLEALIGAIRKLELWGESENPEFFPELKAARAAIAKAKGEQS